MLPSGLVRATVQQRAIVPSLVDPKKPAIQRAAASVVELFQRAAHQQLRLGEVLAEVDEICEGRRDHRMVRGLVHLARTKLEAAGPPPELDCAALRAEVFELAATRGPVSASERHAAISGRPTARAVLDEVGARHQLSGADLAEVMYADLPSEQRLVGFELAEPSWLIDRYNTALVQALLLRATDVVVTLKRPDSVRLRQLFRWVKFHQLLHRVEVGDDEVVVKLDGPMSMFRGSTRYGRQLARFFPALCLQPGAWELAATVLWTRANHRKSLAITHQTGLVSHLADTGAYRSKAVEHIAANFSHPEWTLHDAREPIVLGPGDTVFPDFVAQRGAQRVHLEVLGHWRLDSLQRRLAALDREGRPPLVFAVSRRLASGKGQAVPDHDHVVGFAEVLSARQLVPTLEHVAGSSKG